VATVVPAKEFLLNLYRDLMQPSLGSIRPLLVVPGVCLKLPYSVFGGAKLSRQLVSHFDGLLLFASASLAARWSNPKIALPARSSGSPDSDLTFDFGAIGMIVSAATKLRLLITLHSAPADRAMNFTTSPSVRQFGRLWITPLSRSVWISGQ